MVTENDIISNAAEIAALINAGPNTIEISGLDEKTSLDSNDWFHIQDSADSFIDKKVKKSLLADPLFLGWYATEAALNAAHPTALDGNYAIVGTTDTIWIWDGDTNAWVNSGSSSGTIPDKEIVLYSGGWDYTTNAPAPFEYDDFGANGKIGRVLLDDTTEEFLGESLVKIPYNFDPTGSVIFEINGYSKIAAASKNVAFKIYYSAVDDAESLDKAYSFKASGDLATDANQDYLDMFEITETAATLGFTAGEVFRIKVSRVVAGVNNLTDDYCPVLVNVRLPRA